MMHQQQNNFYVYQLRIIDEVLPFYVGKGHNNRAYSHLKLGKRDNSHKANKIKKAMRENREIVIEFLKENLCEDDAFMWEVFYIAEYGRKDLGLGSLTNMTDGGEGMSGHIQSDDTKNKRIESRKRFYQSLSEDERKEFYSNRLGFRHSMVSRKNMSESKKGIIFSEEHKKNLSRSQIGKTIPDEQKKAISSSLKGRVFTESHRNNLTEAGKRRTDRRNTRPLTHDKWLDLSEEEQKQYHRCEHCFGYLKLQTYRKTHGDNCKNRKEVIDENNR